jgi:translation initiation factor 4A
MNRTSNENDDHLDYQEEQEAIKRESNKYALPSSLQMDASEDIESYSTFEEMGLSDDLLRGIYSYGFDRPSHIQQRAIKPLISGVDLIAQAQSGTGKTGTFSIGSLQRVDPKINKPQILVIVPTRELAIQVTNVYKNLGEFLNLKIHTSIGGTRPQEEERILKRGVHVVIGTPGRLYDVLNRNIMESSEIKTCILDEADEMLSSGFADDIREIFHLLPGTMQVALFSATMPEEALSITKKFMNNPKKIFVKRDELTLEGILQYYVDVGSSEYKFETICDLYDALNVSQSVIFCSTIRRVEYLAEEMKKKDFTVSAIHGKMTQDQRRDIMGDFRSGKIRFLIATDLVARGIDVQGVSVVVNYDLPTDRENYIHRIGRAGRFGRKGLAISLITERDANDLSELERFYKTQIEQLPANISSLI